MSYFYSDWIEHDGKDCPVSEGNIYHCETFSGGIMTIYGTTLGDHKYWIYHTEGQEVVPAYRGVDSVLCIKRYRVRESSSFQMLEDGARSPDLSKILDFK